MCIYLYYFNVSNATSFKIWQSVCEEEKKDTRNRVEEERDKLVCVKH